MKKHIFLLPILILALVFTGCSDDDDPTPDPVNEQEVITRVTLTMTNLETDEVLATYSWNDPEYGGNGYEYEGLTELPPVPTGCEVNAYNTTLDPSDPEYLVTTEILEEGADHQFFFSTDPEGLVFDFNILSMGPWASVDINGDKIGQKCHIMPYMESAGMSGTLTVLLIHEPDKSAEGVSSGDPTNAGGETDFELTWNFAWAE